MSTNSHKIGFALILLVSLFISTIGDEVRSGKFPLVVSTWPFLEAVRAAWNTVDSGLSAIDAVVEGCSACEQLRCDGTGGNLVDHNEDDDRVETVGNRIIELLNKDIPQTEVYREINSATSIAAKFYDQTIGPGGSPDENGETTIDAMIMNGVTMEVGAVAAMRYVSDGIRAARLVMQHTEHTFLVGEQASIFAISMGLPGPTNLSSEESTEKWINWKKNRCQPNFRKNVVPVNDCGPYHLQSSLNLGEKACLETDRIVLDESQLYNFNLHNHDTIAMAVIDKTGLIAVGTSTNGATFKIPGRVGDGAIAGSSAYADTEVGACGATGDGDIMMRFLPCYQVVESMRLGMKPKLAAEDAIARIARKYPDFVGAVFAVDKNGSHAGACHGWTFQYSVRSPDMADVVVYTVNPHISTA